MSDTVSLILLSSFYMKGYFLVLDGLFLLLHQIRFFQMYIFRGVLGLLMVSFFCFTFYLPPSSCLIRPGVMGGRSWLTEGASAVTVSLLRPEVPIWLAGEGL